MGRRGTGITRDQVVALAVELADADGLAAVSMRALAGRLAVTPMALYSRIADKDELLDAMIEAIIGELEPPADESPWPDRLRHLGHQIRAVGHRHPGVFPLLMQRPVTAAAAHAPTEILLSGLTAAGLDDTQVLRFEQLISTWALGFVTSEISGRYGPGRIAVKERLAALPPAEFPQHQRLRKGLRHRDWDAEFEFSLDHFVAEIERLGASGR